MSLDFVIGLAAGVWIGVCGAMAAYRNGVRDGAHNQWLPRVRKILNLKENDDGPPRR